MDSIDKILGKIFDTDPQFVAKQKTNEIYEAWPIAVGPKISQHCWPVQFFNDGVLLVGSENSMWIHQLKYLEPQIIENLRKTLGDKRVLQLRFKLDVKSI